MAAIHALRRHWLKQTLLSDDRQTLIDCFQQIKGGFHSLPLTLVDDEVKALFPDLSKGANVVFIEALYGGRLPTGNMAIALALDEIDGTPDKWVAEVNEENRWEQQEDSQQLEIANQD